MKLGGRGFFGHGRSFRLQHAQRPRAGKRASADSPGARTLLSVKGIAEPLDPWAQCVHRWSKLFPVTLPMADAILIKPARNLG